MTGRMRTLAATTTTAMLALATPLMAQEPQDGGTLNVVIQRNRRGS